ncbi:MAG: hypothetical protein M0T80_09535 [Actinomycetota bacterium]|nr:hypothetical protein [Actinomycetota bacterium]
MRSSLRFAAPVFVAGLIGAGAAVPAVASGSQPVLAAQSPQQLVSEILGARPAAVSGSLEWAPDLGLPSLGELASGGQGIPSAGGIGLTGLLGSDQSLRLWADGSDERVAIVQSLAEVDLLRRGSTVWVWDSSDQQVERYVLPSGAEPAQPPSASAPFDPQSVAAAIVSHLESAGTTLGVAARPVYVAGVPCRVLELRPTDTTASTVSSVDLAVDARNGVVLQVVLRAAGQATPALSLGFTSVSFTSPPASVFAVPAGSSVSTRLGAPGSGQLTGAPGGSGWYAYAPLSGRSYPSGAGGSAPQVLGHGWSSVLGLSVPATSPSFAELSALGHQVSGSFGSGRLVRSSLLDLLVLPDGHLLVGFVPPAVLEADAATLGG